MAKVPFSKLQAKVNNKVVTLSYNNLAGEEIYYEVKSYLSFAEKLDLVPSLTASGKLLPLCNSSLIRENVITFESTAIPIPNTKAAIPGSVNTPPINQNTKNTKNVYNIIAHDAINPAK